MTRDEIQKLIGGYATGSLTEAERKLLFDAALEDQDLFDQLAHEQALKEMLEEPGAKQRLLAALETEKPRQLVWWPWASATVTASLAILIGVVMLRTPEKPQQIAAVPRVAEAPAPVAQSEPAAPVTAPVPAPVTAPASKPQQPERVAPEGVAKDAPAPRVFAPPAVPEKAPPPPAPAPIELPKDALVPVIPPPAVAAPKDLILGFRDANESSQSQAGQNGRALAGPAAPAGIAGAPAFAGGGGAKGGGKGGRGGGAAPQNAARAVATRFAFDYSFDDTGALRIVPTAAGSLTMTVPDQPRPSVLLPPRDVAAGTPVVVPIPPGVSELIVSFTGSAVAGITGTPVRRDEASGTVEDQSPPNRRILVTIPVKR